MKILKNHLGIPFNIKTNNWHTKTYVTPEHNYWIGDLSTSSRKTINSSGKSKLLDQLTKTSPPKSKYKWENIENCFEKKILLMPKNIDWDLPENFCIDLSKYNLRGKIDDDYIYTYNQYFLSNESSLNEGKHSSAQALAFFPSRYLF